MSLNRTVALVGMMGAGKTSVGRLLAQKLGLPFIDADSEIEQAAQATISEIFERPPAVLWLKSSPSMASRNSAAWKVGSSPAC